MITEKKIQVPIYNFTVYVNIFDKWDEIKKYYIDNPDNEREGFMLVNDLQPTKIRLFVNAECPSCIVHEIIHIKNEIFNVINHTIDKDNDEPEAYLVQYLYNKIVDVYYKHIDNTTKGEQE